MTRVPGRLWVLGLAAGAMLILGCGRSEGSGVQVTVNGTPVKYRKLLQISIKK